MPSGRAKLTSLSIVVIALAIFLAACGGGTKHHTWEAEFDERLEASAAAIEERLGEYQPDSHLDQLIETGSELSPKLAFKSELIRNLNPPTGCEEVQEKGSRTVYSVAEFTSELVKNLTPYLRRKLPRPLEEGLAEFKEVEGEAAHCATG